jgi:hypothetical protein
MTHSPDFNALAARFDGPQVKAVTLMGSFARGDAGPFSDIDVVRFTGLGPACLPLDGTHLIETRLVVASTVNDETVERWFNEPDQAVKVIAGLCSGRALIDRDGYFAALQARAQAFRWDANMQQKANQYASRQMVDWIEEVHKGLEGLQRGDPGRLLNARFGLTWGLAGVMLTQRGVLEKGDNHFFNQLLEEFGENSEWSRLFKAAFGMVPLPGTANDLPNQVRAGLRLYVLTANLLGCALQPGDSDLIRQTVARIESNVEEEG